MASETVLTYKQNDYIWIICKKSVYIRQLRRSGPIIAPLKVKMSTAYSIVCSGIELIQFCPVTMEYAKMTTKNAYRVDKFPKYNALLLRMQQANQTSEDENEETETANAAASTMSLRAASFNEPDAASNDETAPLTENVDGETSEEEIAQTTEASTGDTVNGDADSTEETSEEETEVSENKDETEATQTENKSSGKKKKKK